MDKTPKTKKAMFGAGCFWGVQFYFDQVPGVLKTTVGYAGGHTANPTYEEVCTHTTGHAEVVLIEYDPTKVGYTTLVKQFFRMHDPTQYNRQGPDVGDNYRSVIFYYDEKQRQTIEEILAEVQSTLNKPVVTEIAPVGEFYKAEEYHQKFSQKTGRGMCHVDYAAV